MREGEKKKSMFSGERLLECILFVSDLTLFLVIIPLCCVANWIGTYYFLLLTHKPDSWVFYVKFGFIVFCALVFTIKHIARIPIYKFIRDHITSEVKFYVISKIYIYIFSLSSTVLFCGVFERKLNAISFAEEPLQSIIVTAVGFFLLLCLKCRPTFAGGFSDVGKEKTAEDVFLFPITMFETTDVLLTEQIGNRFLYFFSSRLYTQIFGIASVSSWFGIWTAFDSITGAEIKITIVIVVISYIGLFCTKTVRNITASPFAVITDKRQGYFDVPTLFQWSDNWKKNKFLYILDSIFSVFIVGTLVILVWRGAWCLLDQTIYPGDDTYVLSGWISLGIGYSIVFATFALQRVMKMLIRKCHGWKRLVIIDIYVVVSFCGTINIWRGIWILLEVFAQLEKSLLNCLILHFLSFFILVIFNSSNTLLVRGVYIDAEENGEDCVEFPCYYFRLRFQEKQKKKTLLELNMVNNKVHNTNNDKDTFTYDDQVKKSDPETEVNTQQVPLMNVQNSVAEVKLEEKSTS